MTLALRLQIAFGLLALVATGAVGCLTRTAWQTAEEDRFDQQLALAGQGVAKLIEGEASQIADLLQSTCDRNGDIDQTAMDVEHGLTAERRLAISQLVKDQMKALHLDELLVFTGTGEILGAGHDPAAAGKVDRALVAQSPVKAPSLVVRPAGPRTKAALLARCSHTFGSQVISLMGARHLEACSGASKRCSTSSCRSRQLALRAEGAREKPNRDRAHRAASAGFVWWKHFPPRRSKKTSLRST